MNKIPKIIHYCWFGGNELNALAEKCIQSWKINCPDYEIIRWDENTFDVNSNQFVREAFEEKKWAFISDYVRLFALFNHGGIYMDTDVEVVKPLDEFLMHKAFTGCENDQYCVTGTMGAERGHSWIKELLLYYDNLRFKLSDGSLNLITNTQIITNITIKKYHWKPSNDYQLLNDGLSIYPFNYFCAKDWYDGKIYITDQTHTIHHFSSSWKTDEEKKEYKKQLFFTKIFGKKNGSLIYRISISIRNNGLIKSIVKATKKLIKKSN